MTATQRSQRIGLLDRPWVGHRSVLLATPLAVPAAAAVRELLADFAAQHPTAPIVSRLDTRAGRWVQVPETLRRQHLQRIVREAPDPDPADLDGHVRAHLPLVEPDLPFLMVVGPTSIMTLTDHALGDAVTLTRQLFALAGTDRAGLAELTRRATVLAPARALLRGARQHLGEWTGHVRARTGPAAPEVTGPPAPVRPAFTSTVLDNDALRAVTRWRNANARGVPLTCVYTSAMHLALRANGIPMADNGFYALLDTRSLVSPDRPVWGNLSKAIYLAADVADPHAVRAALDTARNTQRALPATLIGALGDALRMHPPRPAVQPPVTPALLTFNSMPSMPGMSDLPWLTEANRRYYGFGPSLGPGDVSVCAIRLRDHMELLASFDEATASVPAVASALAAMADPAALFSAAAHAGDPR